MRRKIENGVALLCVVGVVAALAISAYGAFHGGSANARSSKVESGAITIEIKGLAFVNGTRTVTPGTKVTWKNLDGTAHTVTAADKSFDSGSKNRGQTYARAFAELGTYHYSCTIHPFMKGTITVVLPYGKG
jgi:plastocyanin